MDVNSLEKIQERASKIPVTSRDMDYEIRLLKMALKKLSEKRIRGDLVEILNTII